MNIKTQEEKNIYSVIDDLSHDCSLDLTSECPTPETWQEPEEREAWQCRTKEEGL